MSSSIEYALASPEQIVADLGRRIEALRLARNLRREDLAAKAGIATRTLARFESSGRATLETLVRVLAALHLTDVLQALVPDPSLSPIDRLETQAKPRRRARLKPTPHKPGWTWGDES